jgi:hypothetical protein
MGRSAIYGILSRLEPGTSTLVAGGHASGYGRQRPADDQSPATRCYQVVFESFG